jgi:hypothetical protein
MYNSAAIAVTAVTMGANCQFVNSAPTLIGGSA